MQAPDDVLEVVCDRAAVCLCQLLQHGLCLACEAGVEERIFAGPLLHAVYVMLFAGALHHKYVMMCCAGL